MNEGDTVPQVVSQNDTRKPPAPPWHDKEENPDRPNDQWSGHNYRPCYNKGL